MTERQINVELAHRIKAIRKARRLKQTDVARATRLTRSHISNTEHGTHNIQLWRLAQYAEIFGVEPWQILHPDWQILCRCYK